MARHGQLTVVNLTNEDLKVKAHQHGKGPKEFSVGVGDTVRKTGIRIDRSDWPRNYKRKVEFFDKRTGKLLASGKYTYKVTLGYELILSIDKISGSYSVKVLSKIPTAELEKLEKEFIEGLQGIVENGLDYLSESDTEDEDATLQSEID